MGSITMGSPGRSVPPAVLTPAVADAPVPHDELVLQRVQDLDFPLEVPQLLGRILLQLLHRHQLTRAVTQRVIAAQLHAPKIALARDSQEGLWDAGRPQTPPNFPPRLPTHSTNQAFLSFAGKSTLLQAGGFMPQMRVRRGGFV